MVYLLAIYLCNNVNIVHHKDVILWPAVTYLAIFFWYK